MKKIYIIVTMLVISSLSSMAADPMEYEYSPYTFLEEDRKLKIWHLYAFNPEHYTEKEHEYDIPEAIEISMSSSSSILEISGKTYTELTKTGYHDYKLQRALGRGSASKEVVGYFREEAGKVFKYDQEAEKEYLFYDFTLTEGDKFLYYSNANDDNPTVCTVSCVDYIQIGNSTFRRWHLMPEGSENETIWIDGVGNDKHPFIPVRTGKSTDDRTYCLAYVSSFKLWCYAQSIDDLHFKMQPYCLNPNDKVKRSDTTVLKRDFVGDKLHIYGYYEFEGNYLQCVHCIDKGDGHIWILTVSPSLMSCMSGIFPIDIYFSGFNEATDIKTTKKKSRMHENLLFNFSGQQLQGQQSGFLLINGRKVLVRNK